MIKRIISKLRKQTKQKNIYDFGLSSMNWLEARAIFIFYHGGFLMLFRLWNVIFLFFMGLCYGNEPSIFQ